MHLELNYTQIDTDVSEILKNDLSWELLEHKKILITGGSGMLAAYIVDLLLSLHRKIGCRSPEITIIVRNVEKAKKRFSRYLNTTNFKISTINICDSSRIMELSGYQVIIHAASIPRPDLLVPVEVMEPNILGTWNLLQAAHKTNGFEQFIYFSSTIAAGDEFKDGDSISETSNFPLSSLKPESCYSESKRAAESICLAFMKQHKIPIKILRYATSFGPGMDFNEDIRAFTLIQNAIRGEDIILFSDGKEYRSA